MPEPGFDPQICELCWETFETPAALAEHIAAEEARAYTLDGAE